MKFIRKNGRIVPIKEEGDPKRGERKVTHNNGKHEVTLTLKDKKTTIGERFKNGATLGLALGGTIGAEIGGSNAGPSIKSVAKGSIKGAGIGMAIGGLAIGALNALIGRRKKTVITDVERDGVSLKKKKK